MIQDVYFPLAIYVFFYKKIGSQHTSKKNITSMYTLGFQTPWVCRYLKTPKTYLRHLHQEVFRRLGTHINQNTQVNPLQLATYSFVERC